MIIAIISNKPNKPSQSANKPNKPTKHQNSANKQLLGIPRTHGRNHSGTSQANNKPRKPSQSQSRLSQAKPKAKPSQPRSQPRSQPSKPASRLTLGALAIRRSLGGAQGEPRGAYGGAQESCLLGIILEIL